VTKSVVVAFHNYCWTMDHRYFDVLFQSFMYSFEHFWKDEVDMLYILDSTWGATYDDPKVTVVKVDQNLRYYDAYKNFLPKIKEDLGWEPAIPLETGLSMLRRWVEGNI